MMDKTDDRGFTQCPASITGFDIDKLDWSKQHGLLPAIVQSAVDRQVLMLGFMSREALAITIETGMVTFFSRSRQQLWKKGERSGHILELVSITTDCDRDALLVTAKPHGPTCHLGTSSCFASSDASFLDRLDELINDRERARPAGSYTTMLFESGVRRIAQKLGEEGVETALAAVSEDDEAFLGESADLVYHLLVLLRARGLGIKDLERVLVLRHCENAPL